VHKYEAIEILKKLSDVKHSCQFIVDCILGEIYNDVEQISDSVKSYQSALEGISKLSPTDTWKYYQYLIVIYNNLGLSHLNRDEN
jgi:hypothetical protein